MALICGGLTLKTKNRSERSIICFCLWRGRGRVFWGSRCICIFVVVFGVLCGNVFGRFCVLLVGLLGKRGILNIVCWCLVPP